MEDDISQKEDDKNPVMVKDDPPSVMTTCQEDVPDTEKTHTHPHTHQCHDDMESRQEDIPVLLSTSANPHGANLAAIKPTTVQIGGSKYNPFGRRSHSGDIRRYVIHGRPHKASTGLERQSTSGVPVPHGDGDAKGADRKPSALKVQWPTRSPLVPSVATFFKKITDKSNPTNISNDITVAPQPPPDVRTGFDDPPPPSDRPPSCSRTHQYHPGY